MPNSDSLVRRKSSIIGWTREIASSKRKLVEYQVIRVVSEGVVVYVYVNEWGDME